MGYDVTQEGRANGNNVMPKRTKCNRLMASTARKLATKPQNPVKHSECDSQSQSRTQFTGRPSTTTPFEYQTVAEHSAIFRLKTVPKAI